MNGKPVIVVSAIRFFQGGAIVVVNECLQYLSRNYAERFEIKALVYSKLLYDPVEGIEWIEFPKARNSSLRRLYYEYLHFKKLSLQWKPTIWLSLQDSTPNVAAQTRAVYFHNPLLLKPANLHLWKAQPRLWLLWFLYKHVYIKGINLNDFVFTQQEHVARFLATRYVKDKRKIWVFPPKLDIEVVAGDGDVQTMPASVPESTPFTFIFPATPFYYKHYDLLLQACAILHRKGVPFRLLLTIDGTENHYTQMLVKTGRHTIPEIEFLGFQKRVDLFTYYQKADCMVFPSLLESWGLPLTEFSRLGKPVLCADLPYGRESLAGYSKACFFDPHRPELLAELMEAAIYGRLSYDENPMRYDWQRLGSWEACFALLLGQPS